jgi:hypothetical protein
MINLPFGKKGDEKAGSGEPGAPARPEEKKGNRLEHSSGPKTQESDDHELCRRRMALLRGIIERYREQIEMGETKTVPDLRNLIDSKNKAILQVKMRIGEQFHPYLYDANFEEAANKAFEFIRNEIGNETLPVDFWLYPEDVLEFKLADEMDKAIFLCSLLIALDNDTARVVVETGGHRHAFVLFEFGGKFRLMDPVHNVNISGSREEVLKEHLAGYESKVIYEFNQKGYEEW